VADSRIRVSKSLYLRALADAMEWQISYLQSHDPQLSPCITSGCCGPETGRERCDDYKLAAELLSKYKRAFARAKGCGS
jgi:hypothetical protein